MSGEDVNKATFINSGSLTEMFSSTSAPPVGKRSVAQLYDPEVRPLSLRVQHPGVGHVDKQGVALLQPNPPALLGAVHVVAGDVPAHGAARLHDHHRLAVLFDALVGDVLDELGVAHIHWWDSALTGILWSKLVVAEAGLGVDVVEARLHHQQLALLVAHSVAVAVLLVPFDGDGLRLTLCKNSLWLKTIIKQ